jgi:galactose mutarotase-like enzyme
VRAVNRGSTSLVTHPSAAASRLVRLEDGGARALVYPEQGFQLHGFWAPVPAKGGAPIDAIFAPASGREPADRRCGNPVLFPSVGVTHGAEESRWSWRGRTLPMQQHGWARDAYWHVEAQDARSITGLLVPSTGFKMSFPFTFELRLRYALEGGALVLTAEVANLGDEPFPYALGFHPYLHAPLGAGGSRERCRVRLPAGTRLSSGDSWRTVARAAASARTIAVSEAELPGSIVLADTGATALEVEDEAAGVAARVSVEGSETTFPTWVVWSAAPDAPYVCLEPWTDAPNALNRPTTRTLGPGDRARYRMAISLRAL